MPNGAYVRALCAAALVFAMGGCARLRAPGGQGRGAATAGVPRLQLSPASGPAGTVVAVSGTLNAALGAGAPETSATVCFGGCGSGYLEQAVPVVWTGRSFTVELRVPDTAWLTASGPRPLRAGRYAVTVRCLLRPAKGADCAGGPDEALGTFRLTGPMRAAPPFSLRFTPAGAAPGATVRISGWAPLTPLLGPAPAGYTLVVEGGEGAAAGTATQDAQGALSGTLTVPDAIPGLGVVAAQGYAFALQSGLGGLGPVATLLPPATLAVTAPPPLTWAGLGAVHPLWIAPAVGPAQAADPSDPQREARCTAAGLETSADGGRTWSAVPTSGVLAAAEGTPYKLFPPGLQPAGPSVPCTSVALDPAHPGTIYAAFSAAAGDPPPDFWLPLETDNGGRTWRAVPAPRGANPAGFGRFIAAGGAVQALWAAGPGGTGYAVEQNTGGGAAWEPGRLACPASGPCVVWGPAPNGSWPGACTPQILLASADGGATWAPPAGEGEVCYIGTGLSGPYELAALSQTEVALLGDWDEPMLLSTDGGATWTDVALPLPPSTWGVGTDADRFPDLQMLADGALRVDGWLLAPGAAQWCAVGDGASACGRDGRGQGGSGDGRGQGARAGAAETGGAGAGARAGTGAGARQGRGRGRERRRGRRERRQGRGGYGLGRAGGRGATR